MLRLLTCERGHFWETGEERCPQCGGPSDAAPVLEAEDVAPAVSYAPVEEPADPSRIPTVAGYDIVEDLGRGPTGMRLYKAKSRAVGRMVLLEVVLAKEDPSQHAWSSLRSQAAALARLAHPGVMQLWEAGERDRQLFYNACEWVEGPTLRQKVAGKPLPIPQAVRLVEALARTIDHAHAASVLHRNLRPDAIRLQPTQMSLKLPDRESQPGAAVFLHGAAFLPRIDGFGLVRRPVEGETVDAELYGEEIGFLSPEQAWGRVADLGNATDVWGLGAILYFLIADEAPYDGERRADVIEGIQTGDPGWSRLKRGGNELRAIVRKAMSRSPSRRYPSAGAMADDLRRFLLGLPLSLHEPAAGYLFGKWLRRHALAAALVVVATMSVAASYLAGSLSSDAAKREAATLRGQVGNLTAQLAHTTNELNGLRRQARFAAYRQTLTQAVEQIRAGEVELARQTLDRADPADRGFEWFVAHEQTHRRGKVDLPKFEGGIASAVLDPTGRSVVVATGAAGGEWLVWHLPTRGETLKRADLGGPIRALAMSPAGDVLVARADGAVKAWHLGEGENRGRRLYEAPFRAASPLAMAVGDTQVAVMDANGGLTLLELGSGNPIGLARRPWQPGKERIFLAWHGAGQLALAQGTSGTVNFWNTTTSRVEWSLPHRGANVTAMASGGDELVIACQDKMLRFASRSVGPNDRDGLGPLPNVVRQLAFSSDGTRLAAACEEGKVVVFARSDPGWVEVLTLTADGTAGLAFGAGGHVLLTAGPKGGTVWGRLQR